MRFLERLLLPLLGILLVLLCWNPLGVGSDFWAHAAVGRWIFEHRAVPRAALFIWTFNGPWLAHSWLSELACYGLMRLGGDWGGPVLAVAFTALIGLIIFAVALWPILRSQRRLPLLVAGSAFLAILCCSNRFVPRPEIFTTLFTVCLYSALASLRHADEQTRARRGTIITDRASASFRVLDQPPRRGALRHRRLVAGSHLRPVAIPGYARAAAACRRRAQHGRYPDQSLRREVSLDLHAARPPLVLLHRRVAAVLGEAAAGFESACLRAWRWA